MIRISKAALAAALLAGASGLAFAPAAHAQKKQEKAKSDGYKLNDTVRNAAAAAQTALTAKDYATAETSIAAAEAGATNDDEHYVATTLRLQLVAAQSSSANDTASNARNDQAMIAPLDTLIANPRTPADQRAKYNYLRGSIAFNAKKYPEALGFYTKAQAAGYQDPDLSLQIVKSKVESGDVKGGMASLQTILDQQKAGGSTPPEAWYRYAIAHLYQANDQAGSLAWVQRWLQAYPTAKNWRDAIITFGFQGPSAKSLTKAQQVDLYRLMRATNSLADQNDYLAYAALSKELGLPNETKTVIEEGKAKGKIPSGNASATTLTKDADSAIRADGSLTSLATKAKASAKGDLAAQTGDAYLGAGEYAPAIELYRAALQKGGVNNDVVNTHLGQALALSGDKAGGKTAFSAVTTQPQAQIALLWNTWIDQTSGTTAAAAPATTAPAS